MKRKNKKNNNTVNVNRFPVGMEIAQKHPVCAMKGSGRIPVGCEACGGPYPLCCGSCPMFD